LKPCDPDRTVLGGFGHLNDDGTNGENLPVRGGVIQKNRCRSFFKTDLNGAVDPASIFNGRLAKLQHLM